MHQFLDGSRYISGVWRILDSWGNIHSVILGKGPLGWFYGYGAYKPQEKDATFSVNYLDEVLTEECAEHIIAGTIRSLFIDSSDLYKKEFGIEDPPTLVRQHYFEIRSNDPARIRSVIVLATKLSITDPI